MTVKQARYIAHSFLECVQMIPGFADKAFPRTIISVADIVRNHTSAFDKMIDGCVGEMLRGRKDIQNYEALFKAMNEIHVMINHPDIAEFYSLMGHKTVYAFFSASCKEEQR